MRSFAGIATFPFQPAIAAQPLWRGRPNAYPPSVVKTVIQWSIYFALSGNAANVAVLLNLASQKSSNQPPLDDLKSVYVDNTGSPVPIYLLFPSTGFTVAIAPNTADWYPVYTTDYVVQVNALGLTAGNLPTTGIWFANVLMQPYSDPEISQTQVQYLASATITRGTTIYNTNFGVPALGDQFTSATLQLAGNSNQNVFTFGTGFIYITAFEIVIMNAVAGGAPGSNSSLIFESTGVAGIFLSIPYTLGAAVSVPTARLTGLAGNYKIDGSQTWRVRNQAGGGAAWATGQWFLNMSFTTNPN
jgi:hypothetical protein